MINGPQSALSHGSSHSISKIISDAYGRRLLIYRTGISRFHPFKPSEWFGQFLGFKPKFISNENKLVDISHDFIFIYRVIGHLVNFKTFRRMLAKYTKCYDNSFKQSKDYLFELKRGVISKYSPFFGVPTLHKKPFLKRLKPQGVYVHVTESLNLNEVPVLNPRTEIVRYNPVKSNPSHWEDFSDLDTDSYAKAIRLRAYPIPKGWTLAHETAFRSHLDEFTVVLRPILRFCTHQHSNESWKWNAEAYKFHLVGKPHPSDGYSTLNNGLKVTVEMLSSATYPVLDLKEFSDTGAGLEPGTRVSFFPMLDYRKVHLQLYRISVYTKSKPLPQVVTSVGVITEKPKVVRKPPGKRPASYPKKVKGKEPLTKNKAQLLLSAGIFTTYSKEYVTWRASDK